MIQSFADKASRSFFLTGKLPKGCSWADVQRVVARKLLALHAATSLDDLKAPPGNRLEALKGDRAGQHSIRVNDQWRVCFVWTAQGPEDVTVTDYH
ncbi:MAG: plasmid maintenance system killer protein [Oceanicaulis sp.]|uniref:type II toxin-antitoxin system RelE/ParE family toxin n=1 Tax=Oceanicaulis TaxID=153232 RepID=UPI000C0BAAF9|nr:MULTISPECIES: type II toxin-antitoxin system RelE/ParE family toxin [Oceanicaulis]MAP47884.1 plasmid maintenance system killer protein [Oceanicaulis sp.]|tara:strand:- start:572 stop:859 length:288 start_codon:yes stop_codon:yes gene_type:complete